LGYRARGAGIQRATDRRLLSTLAVPKGRLECHVGTHAQIDFVQPMPTGQDIDEAIQQLIERIVMIYLLFDLNELTNCCPEIHKLKV
jgi:hypothetical protein